MLPISNIERTMSIGSESSIGIKRKSDHDLEGRPLKKQRSESEKVKHQKKFEFYVASKVKSKIKKNIKTAQNNEQEIKFFEKEDTENDSQNEDIDLSDSKNLKTVNGSNNNEFEHVKNSYNNVKVQIFPYNTNNQYIKPTRNYENNNYNFYPQYRYNRLIPTRLLLDSMRLGALIGIGGCTIKKIRAESRAKIFIEKQTKKCFFRVSKIEGSHNQVRRGLEMIIDKMVSEMMYHLTILVDNQNIQDLVGENNYVIDHIRNLTNANIYISDQVLYNSSEKTIDIVGDKQAVCDASWLIVCRLRSSLNYTSASKPYDPNNDIYQHTIQQRRFQQIQKQKQQINDFLEWEEKIKEESELLFSIKREKMDNSFNSPLNSDESDSSDSSQTKKMVLIPVPARLINDIIGKSSQNISEIRKKSRAEINISGPTKSKNIRILTVRGSESEIQMAADLISSFLSTH